MRTTPVTTNTSTTKPMRSLAEALEERRSMQSGKIWASEIRPNFLYLGAGRDAANLEKLREHRVTHILNVADDVENFHPGEFIYKNLMVTDFGGDKGISRVFTEAYEFVVNICSGGERNNGGDTSGRNVTTRVLENNTVGDENTENTDVVADDDSPGSPPIFLVHCANGSNRSATVTIALLMLLENLTLAQAFEEVKSKRPSINPLKDNRLELVRFERKRFKLSPDEGTLWAKER